MATNLRIFAHRTSEKLRLKSMGDFDGTSAHGLLKTLKRYCNRTSRIFIHTNCLRNIGPFGLKVFRENLDVLNGQSRRHASRLAPQNPIPFSVTISTIPPVAQSGTPISPYPP